MSDEDLIFWMTVLFLATVLTCMWLTGARW